jgi:hypothetical protein
MEISSGDISAVVFKRVVNDDLGRFSFDSQMLTVFMALDGKKRLGTVSKEIGLNMGTLKAVISRLVRLKLIQPVEEAFSVLDDDFLNFLRNELSFAIGPLADVLIEDAAEDLGCGLDRFPSHRAAELVELLAQDVQRDEKKAAFRINMVKKIKEKGY